MSREGLDPESFRQPFMEHMRELRQRMVHGLGFLFLGFVVAFVFREAVYDWFMGPYRSGMIAAFGEDARITLDFRGPVEPILVYIKAALLASFLVTVPMLLYQVWQFVVPGLYPRERTLALPFVLASYLFFLGGVLFCRYFVLEPAMTVLLGFPDPAQARPTIMMEEYFSFTSRMLVLFGAMFELPVVISFLSFLGLVKAKTLLSKWRYVLVGAFVVGAMLTPPDPLTQIALAGPMTLLYFLAVGMAWIIERFRGEHDVQEPVHPYDGDDTPGR